MDSNADTDRERWYIDPNVDPRHLCIVITKPDGHTTTSRFRGTCANCRNHPPADATGHRDRGLDGDRPDAERR
jgi:hypothetical protein